MSTERRTQLFDHVDEHAAVLADGDGARGGLDPAPDDASRTRGKQDSAVVRDVDDIRSYLRTHVRAYTDSRR